MTSRPQGSGFAWRLSAFYGAVFSFTGAQLPFLPLWLAWRGLTPAEISIIAAAPLFVRIPLTPVIAYGAERYANARATLVLLGWLAFALLIALAGAKGFAAILALTLVIAVAWSSMLPLAETVAMRGVRSQGLDYGRMRLWGSLTFIAASVGGGLLVEGLGAGSAVWLMAAAAATTAAAAHVLPRIEDAHGTPMRKPAPADVAKLFGTGRFLLFLVAVGAVQGAHALFYTLGTVHWRAQGLSAGWCGALWAIGVIAEIVLFAFSGAAVRTCGAIALIAAGAVAALLRWTVMSFEPGLPLLIALQLLHGMTYGATHIGAVHYLSASVPQNLAVTAQAVYASVTSGIAMGGATLLAGRLYTAWGGRAYLAMAAIALIGLVASVWLMRLTALPSPTAPARRVG